MYKIYKENKIGVLLAGAHVVLFLLFLISLEFLEQSAFYWMLWQLVDFPVGILLFIVRSGLDWFVSPDHLLQYYALHFTHGILGTIWWYCIPLIVKRLTK